MAEVAFKAFAQAADFRDTMELFDNFCKVIDVDRTDFSHLYENIKEKLFTSEIKALYNLLDKRASQEVYEDNKACSGAKLLVIGAGPCGLRMALEGALLGCRVVVVEMRDYFARNNVIHMWPFVMQDLRLLGVKYFHPRFSTGCINHSSIRKIQCALLKIALMLGVEVHAPARFVDVREPEEDGAGNVSGWRVTLSPEIPEIKDTDFDIIVGADGKKGTLPGFERKCFRGKQAIAITCNFVNARTREDVRVREIGGLNYYIRMDFFNALREKTGIELENFVYYKNDTHYFVMTAKKKSLLNKGVLIEDSPETSQLLRPENINIEKLRSFAHEAASVGTEGKIPTMRFAHNHKGEEDVAIFDFTAMTQAKYSSLISERRGKRLLKCIVGDSLLEPFWPTGTGAAKGWLSVFDAAWEMKGWWSGKPPLEVLGEREAIFTELSQVSSGILRDKHDAYSIDPITRYKLVPSPLKGDKIRNLWDNDNVTDNPIPTAATSSTPSSTQTSSSTPFSPTTSLIQSSTQTSSSTPSSPTTSLIQSSTQTTSSTPSPTAVTNLTPSSTLMTSLITSTAMTSSIPCSTPTTSLLPCSTPTTSLTPSPTPTTSLTKSSKAATSSIPSPTPTTSLSPSPTAVTNLTASPTPTTNLKTFTAITSSIPSSIPTTSLIESPTPMASLITSSKAMTNTKPSTPTTSSTLSPRAVTNLTPSPTTTSLITSSTAMTSSIPSSTPTTSLIQSPTPTTSLITSTAMTTSIPPSTITTNPIPSPTPTASLIQSPTPTTSLITSTAITNSIPSSTATTSLIPSTATSSLTPSCTPTTSLTPFSSPMSSLLPSPTRTSSLTPSSTQTTSLTPSSTAMTTSIPPSTITTNPIPSPTPTASLLTSSTATSSLTSSPKPTTSFTEVENKLNCRLLYNSPKMVVVDPEEVRVRLAEVKGQQEHEKPEKDSPEYIKYMEDWQQRIAKLEGSTRNST